jgi:hypothetical protein
MAKTGNDPHFEDKLKPTIHPFVCRLNPLSISTGALQRNFNHETRQFKCSL